VQASIVAAVRAKELPAAMASNGHIDVNLPVETRPFAGAAVVLLFHYLEGAGYKPRYERKQVGGHICLNWVYVELGTQKKSEVVFGSTIDKSVNPIPHMWVRGKAGWIDEGLQMLRKFALTVLRELVTRPVRRCRLLATFDVAADYGNEYLDVAAGSHVDQLSLPVGVEGQRWALVMRADRRVGWVPEEWLA
jgi:hypothetical protein